MQQVCNVWKNVNEFENVSNFGKLSTKKILIRRANFILPLICLLPYSYELSSLLTKVISISFSTL